MGGKLVSYEFQVAHMLFCMAYKMFAFHRIKGKQKQMNVKNVNLNLWHFRDFEDFKKQTALHYSVS